MKFFNSLKNLLTFNFILVAILPLLIVGITTLSFMTTGMRQEISDKNFLLAKSLADEIELFLKEPLHLLKQVETLIEQGGIIQSDRINAYLKALIKNYGYLNRIEILDQAGVVLQLAPFKEDYIGINLSGQQFYQFTSKAKKPYWSPTFISMETGQPTLTLTYPLEKGMVVGYLDLSILNAMIDKIKLGDQGYAAIADQKGISIAHPNRELVSQRFSVWNLGIFKKAISGNQGTFKYSFGGEEKLGSVSLVPSTRWSVLVTQPVQEAFASITKTRNLIVTGTLLAVALALIIALYSSRKTLKPLLQLSENSMRIAKGLDTTFDRIKSYSEVDTLAKNFKTMLEALNNKEEAFRKSEERFRALFEGTTSCILFIEDRVLKYVNQAALKTFGYTEEEMIGQSTALIHTTKESYDDSGKIVYRALEKEGSWHGEWPYVKKNGETLWMENHISALSGGGIVSILHDVTGRKEAEEAFRASHERFLTVLDSIDATIYVADMETHEVLFMNKNMIESFGRDMTGEICFKAFRGEHSQCSHCTNDQLVDKDGNPTGVCTWQAENPITGKWYINYDRAIKWIDGRLVRIQIATDITEMKQMEEQLRQSQKMESIGTLAGGIAHDFNNILGIIIGNAELALDDIPEWNPARLNLDEVKTASFRARDIVRQLLSFSRKTEQKRKPIKIGTVILESMKLLRASIPSSIDISSNIQNRVGTVLADPTQIHQVLFNLSTNAAHAMEEHGGVLEIRLKEIELDEDTSILYQNIGPGKYAQLTVSDTGHGIDPKIKDRIFDPYFTTKDVGKGTGMGLAVVHSIVKNHDGAVAINSDPDRGTTINVLFPIIAEEPEKDIVPSKDLPTGKETVLFIDDESALVNMGRHILEGLGYSVETRTDSVEALDLFRSNPDRFDLIITDMTMPKMTGDQLVKEILQTRSEIPIILCTGFSEKIDEAKAEAIGVREYIEKPLDRQKMAEAVRRVLDIN